jgi:hypothetical protein
MLHLGLLKKQEQAKPKAVDRKNNKTRAEIFEMETKRTIERISATVL